MEVKAQLPEIDSDKWTQDERTEFKDKGFRSLRADELPIVSAKVRPKDYTHDLDRGTVDYHADWRNYSFHRVRIKAGSVIRNCNFAQAAPNTDAIIVDGDPDDLTFEDCNLHNVKLNPKWNIPGCGTVQSWLVENAEGQLKREKICSHPNELKGDEQPPANAALSRDF